MILAFMAGARDAKQPKMRGESRQLGHGLGADAAVIGGELDRLSAFSRNRRALSSASKLVGSETTSVPRTVETILFWLASAMAEQEPNGASGESSRASKADAAASRWLSS